MDTTGVSRNGIGHSQIGESACEIEIGFQGGDGEGAQDVDRLRGMADDEAMQAARAVALLKLRKKRAITREVLSGIPREVANLYRWSFLSHTPVPAR